MGAVSELSGTDVGMRRPDRVPMVTATEQDVLTRWRRFYHWRPGECSWWKRFYRRRVRRWWKRHGEEGW